MAKKKKLTNLQKLSKEYERLAKRWQKIHDAYWRKVGARPYVPLGGSDMTQAQAAASNLSKSTRFGNPQARYKPASEFTDISKMRTVMERMRQELDPRAQRRRLSTLKVNMRNAARSINSRTVEGLLSQLTPSQLEDVYNRTDFFERIYDYYRALSGGEPVTDDEERNLIDLIMGALNTSGDERKRAKQLDKVSRYLEKVEKVEAQAAKNRTREEQQRYSLVAQGGTRAEIEQRLKSYAIRPSGAAADWYKNYERYI